MKMDPLSIALLGLRVLAETSAVAAQFRDMAEKRQRGEDLSDDELKTLQNATDKAVADFKAAGQFDRED